MIRKIVKSSLFPFIIYFLIVNIFFLVTQLPVFMRVQRVPQGHEYFLNPVYDRYDYNQYLSAITQGANGAWFYKDSFTSEETQPGYFFTYYILLGKVAGLFSLPVHIAYYVGKIITLEIFFIAVYLLASCFLNQWGAFWAGVFSILGTTLPEQIFREPYAYSTYIPWWDIFLSARGRLDAPPHHLMGQAFLLISLFSLIQFLRNRKRLLLWMSVVTALIAGFTYSPVVLPIAILLPAALIIITIRELVIKRKLIVQHQVLLAVFLVALSGIITAFLAFLETHAGPPWSQWRLWEIEMWNHNLTVNKGFIIGFGILPLLALPAIIRWFVRGSISKIFLILWSFEPFLLLPLVPLLGIGKMRLIAAAPFVPLGILAVVTLWNVLSERRFTVVRGIGILVFLLSVIAVNRSFISRSVSQVLGDPHPEEYYLSKSQITALDFLKQNIPQQSVILSGQSMGNIIPAHVPVRTYLGHIVLTVNWPTKYTEVSAFYNGSFGENEARRFFQRKGIGYIYYGWQEKSMGGQINKYPFLKAVYDSTEVSLYEVR